MGDIADQMVSDYEDSFSSTSKRSKKVYPKTKKIQCTICQKHVKPNGMEDHLRNIHQNFTISALKLKLKKFIEKSGPVDMARNSVYVGSFIKFLEEENDGK